MTFNIAVTEHRTRVYEVEASSKQEAIEKRDEWQLIKVAPQYDHGKTQAFEMVKCHFS